MLLQDIGSPCIPEEINRGKVDSIKGPLVLMVTKVKQKKIYLLYPKEDTKIPGSSVSANSYFPANRSRNRFLEPTSLQIGIVIVCKFQNLQIGIVCMRWEVFTNY